MSLYDAARIEKPRFFSISPLKAGRGKRSRVVIGFDSEAERGHPFMFQFNTRGSEADTELLDVPIPTAAAPHAPLNLFLSWIHRNCQSKTTEYIIVGWNLAYEFTQLFATLPREIYSEDDYHIAYTLQDADDNTVARYNIRVMNNKRYSVVFTRLGLQCRESCTPDNHKCGSKRRIRFIDGMAFYVTSLNNAGQMLGLGSKISKPLHFTRAAATSDHFREYARQDAYLTRRIGENIVALMDEFDVTQCLSAPHFASKVFKRHFLKQPINLPDAGLEQAGLNAYHGGKNGYYLDKPRHLHGIYSYDIVSAYPEAMRAIPAPDVATYALTERYRRGMHGLSRISGTLRPCKYGGCLDHGGTYWRYDPKRPTVTVTDLVITTYELDAMLERGELEMTAFYCYEMIGPTGSGPLVAYVDRFFEMKRTSTGAARAAAKLFLNSLYGKFFQKVPVGSVGTTELTTDDTGPVRIMTDPDREFDYIAGGLYHPPIASLITGFVRARIHNLEHKYNAIMTSTDGFFATKAPDPADIGSGLGQLNVEHGDLMIWRERLYDFTPHAWKYGGRHAGVSEPKYALHGFRGNRKALRKIPLTPGSYSYKAQQMITLRLSTHRLGAQRQQFAPGEFATLDYRLDLTAQGP